MILVIRRAPRILTDEGRSIIHVTSTWKHTTIEAYKHPHNSNQFRFSKQVSTIECVLSTNLASSSRQPEHQANYSRLIVAIMR